VPGLSARFIGTPSPQNVIRKDMSVTAKNQSNTKDAAGQDSSTNEKKLQKLLSTKEAKLQALMQEFETLQQ
jgi:hypothetical protein